MIECENEYGDTRIQSGIDVIEKSSRATGRVLFRIGRRDGRMQMKMIRHATSSLLRVLSSVIWIGTLRNNTIDLLQVNITVEIAGETSDSAYLQEYYERLAQRWSSPMRMSQ